MYKLPHFTENNDELVFDFIMENPFAILIGTDRNFPVATHVPLDIQEHEGKIIFTGHMMKNTDHHNAFLNNDNVLVIFTGPHCYVSASWYEKKNVASTWNYIDVHAKGKIKFTDESGTKNIIRNITNRYEGLESDAAFDKLPGEYVGRLVKSIIGFTIEVSHVGNVFKLSQNHTEDTRQSIINNLKNRNDEASHSIAHEMEKRMQSS